MPARSLTINTCPTWLHPSLAARFAGTRITVALAKEERRVYRRKKPIRPSVWAARHRVLTDGPLAGSRMDMAMTPHAAGIMDASFFPSVRRIVNCKNVQSAGTTTIHTCIAYAADRCPGNTLIAFPDRDRAGKASKDRLQTMIAASPLLKELSTGVEDDMATLRIKLSTMLIYLGWSGSSTSLGDFPAKYVIKEEADKWQEFANKSEAGAHDSIDQRITTFTDAKIWDNSTCTTEHGHIWQALTTATEFVFDFWVRCPDCGQFQLMVFRNFDWPGGSGADPLEVEAKQQAVYCCHHCGVLWSDHQRDQAARGGEWRGVPTREWWQRYSAAKEGDHQAMADAQELFACLRQHHPTAIGFHPTAYHSCFVSLSKTVAAFLRGVGDTPEARKALKSFLNNFAAEPWRTFHQPRREDRILALCDGRPPGLVPGNGQVAGLFAGVDTHGPGADAGFYFVVRAYGWAKRWTEDGGLVDIAQDKWLVRRGFVKTFAALEQVLTHDTYHDAEGNTYPILRVVQDAMGHRAKEVYDFSRKYRGWLHPFKGERNMTQMWKFSQIDQYPGSNKPIPGGVQLLRGNVTLYKNALSTDLEVGPGDPGCRWLHASVETLAQAGHPSPSLGIDLDFCRHLVSEYIDDSGFWECPEGQPNHYWDSEVYADVAADVSQVAMWDPPLPPELVLPGMATEYETARPKNL